MTLLDLAMPFAMYSAVVADMAVIGIDTMMMTMTHAHAKRMAMLKAHELRNLAASG